MNHLKFKKIELSDKPAFDMFLSKFPQKISELTFSNLYCWEPSRKYEFAFYKDHLLISSLRKYDKDDGENSARVFYQPVGASPESIIPEILNIYPESVFERVEKEIAERIKTGDCARQCRIKEQPDMNDYVYLITSLRDLAGRKYEAKRNFIKQCKKYNPEVCFLTDEKIASFLLLEEKWCDIKSCKANELAYAEDAAVKRAILNFKALNLFGICISINNNIEAFCIGEELNDNTFVEHFEKGNIKFKGIYQFALREFAKAISENFKYLNREQDLGIAGLKKSKESYRPEFMIHKYSVSAVKTN